MSEATGNLMAIVFDLGGVLVDWNPRHLYKKLLADDPDFVEWFLSNICTPEWNAKQDAGRPFAEAVAELSLQHPGYENLISAFHTRWEEMVAGAIEPTVAILAELGRAGYPLYALSNWSAETFALMRDRFEFLGWFRAVIISGEARMIKPDPEIYYLLLSEIGRPAGECLFIDDSLPNVLAARDLGFKVIHFQSPESLRGELERMGIRTG
ncbi:MAG TPA: HAD family phosphatase [Blastocatellia bacterium]|nr:HAD family phosphatase [Blastocatellia bacterium]